jgi:hypothetical protein
MELRHMRYINLGVHGVSFANDFADLPILVGVSHLWRQLGFCQGSGFKCDRRTPCLATTWSLHVPYYSRTSL